MAKKPVQFRFEENFHKAIADVSLETGVGVSEIVRDAVSVYLAIYERTRGNKNSRFYIKTNDDLCEVILPWLKY